MPIDIMEAQRRKRTEEIEELNRRAAEARRKVEEESKLNEERREATSGAKTKESTETVELTQSLSEGASGWLIIMCFILVGAFAVLMIALMLIDP